MKEDIVHFTHDLLSNVDDLQSVFTKFFDKHVAMYYLASDYPVSIQPEVNSTTIIYIVKPNKVEELKHIIESLSTPVTVSGITYYPDLEIIDDKLHVNLRDTRVS